MTAATTKPANWKEKLAQLWYETKVADLALQLDKDDRRQRSVERLIRKTQDGTLGEVSSQDDEDESMGVSVGNETITNNYHQPQTPSKSSSVATALVAAGLTAAGIGVGAAAPIAAWNLTRQQASPSEVIQDTDTDTKYGLQIFRDAGE